MKKYIFLACISLLLCAPRALSKINIFSLLDTDLKASTVQFSWLGPQIFKDFSYKDSFYCKNLILYSSLPKFFYNYALSHEFAPYPALWIVQDGIFHVDSEKTRFKNLDAEFKLSKKGIDYFELLSSINFNEHKTGSFEWRGALLAKDDFRNISLNDFTHDTKLAVHNFPTEVLSNEIAQFFMGKSIDLTYYADIENGEGNAHIDMGSKNIHFNGYFHLDDSVVSLQKTLFMIIHVDKVLPFKSPMLSFVPTESVNFYLNDLYVKIDESFHPSEITVNNATLDLGKLRFSNHAFFSSILEAVGGAQEETFDISFDEMNLKLSNNILTVSPVKIFFHNRYPFTLQGSFDIKNNSLNLRLDGSEDSMGFLISGSPENPKLTTQ